MTSGAFYKELPRRYSWSGVKIMPFKRALAELDLRKALSGNPIGSGAYYKVRAFDQGETVIKSSKLIYPLMDMNYSSLAETEGSQGPVKGIGPFNSLALPEGLKAVLPRPLINSEAYEKVGEMIPWNMVQQSILVTYTERRYFNTYREFIFQPFIYGTPLDKMLPKGAALSAQVEGADITIDHRKAGALLLGKYRALAHSILSQYLSISEYPGIDAAPNNFIMTPQGALVYIDYQPVFDPDINRAHKLNMISILQRTIDRR